MTEPQVKIHGLLHQVYIEIIKFCNYRKKECAFTFQISYSITQNTMFIVTQKLHAYYYIYSIISKDQISSGMDEHYSHIMNYPNVLLSVHCWLFPNQVGVAGSQAPPANAYGVSGGHTPPSAPPL